MIHRTLAGAVLGAIVLSATGCGDNKTSTPQYKEPGVQFKPLPPPAGPGNPAPKAQPGGGANSQ